MKLILCIALLCVTNSLRAQVEHNFVLGPSKTTCDSLSITKEDTGGLIETIRNTSFRYQEQMKISRYKIPQQAWYYSCDGQTGYLIVRETKDVEKIYDNVTKETWQTLMDTNDPITLYKKLKEEKVLKELQEE
ncbi:hypothetical protein FNH22_28730 [Fulvivirga sp. M361]|uniref:hypothetical protein n=1 Tax=Fulvivirga sp. M361 TaxID=2594266 RepID=UPI00117A1B3B|nr:hypothetical protein [Fulvivirga sp. M361]TRX48583.1 hypothetical protein FNH22_28730 [Fulvivirga sp. M361]